MKETVRPHFSDGLTLIDADGQYQLADGTSIDESTKVLILVHPDNQEVRNRVGAIITQYRARFQQESVGWVRTSAPACF
jgi:hypothetical protein